MPNYEIVQQVGQKRWNWIFTILQILAVFPIVYWLPYNHLPAPGWAVCLLAVAAALMSVHSEMRDWQKAWWMILMAFLLAIELRAISKDRWDNAELQRAERKTDRAETEGLLTLENAAIVNAHQQYLDTTKKVRNVAHLAEKSLINITGGDSYPFLTPTSIEGDPTTFSLSIHNAGEQPLTGVTLKITQVQSVKKDGTMSWRYFPEHQILVIPANEGETILGEALQPLVGGQPHFHFIVQAQNGTTTEELFFRPAKSGAGLEFSFSVSCPVHGKRRKTDTETKGHWYRECKVVDWTESS